jgi:hypothetical protein
LDIKNGTSFNEIPGLMVRRSASPIQIVRQLESIADRNRAASRLLFLASHHATSIRDLVFFVLLRIALQSGTELATEVMTIPRRRSSSRRLTKATHHQTTFCHTPKMTIFRQQRSITHSHDPAKTTTRAGGVNLSILSSTRSRLH